MAIQTHFNNFDKAIYLTGQSPGYKNAKEKDDSILNDLKTRFKEEGYPVVDTFLQGSFSVNTAINNLDGDYDIDRALVIDEGSAPEDPVKLKGVALEVLTKRSFKNPKVKKPCVTADYLSINLHIDYTIYTRDSSGNYKLAVGKLGSSVENKEWSPTDPKGLMDWINDTSNYGQSALNKRKQYKRLVRYMKRWRDVNFNEQSRKKLFSIGLTIMIKEQYQPDYFSDVEDDLVVLEKVVRKMLNAGYIKLAGSIDQPLYRVSVNLPKSPYRNVFQHKVGNQSWSGSDTNIGTLFRNKLTNLLRKLEEANNETDEIKQCEILNKVFGDDFKIPNSSGNKGTGSVAGLAAAYFPTAGASGTSQGA
ncbi:nucleotidyltransferase [Marinomonas sp. UCMA 3892]|uniref:nucleotidyltransferase domain-containing protein n=1 Tax=Marinomonas sp. UCMA 3892 TaxID=1972585 RepID=UPI00146B98BE|nr:nucleotidyltransferase [Marinomonas sp. UCMA 3892]NLU98889.1 nucleotidyltransferase [Marinomonas sp. UCMA 3892]